MKLNYLSAPDFFVDSVPCLAGTNCRELVRCIEIHAEPSNIYVWLKQLRLAPYSYDLLDNRGIESPGYIIENLPPLEINMHFLLAFHIFAFEEDKFIAGRFCVPINPPVSRYMKEMFLEYRIQELGTTSRLWFKVRGFFNNDIFSKGFFDVFSVVNRIMTIRQLTTIKRLSEKLEAGMIRKGECDLSGYHSESGLLWWLFCRRRSCRGLMY